MPVYRFDDLPGMVGKELGVSSWVEVTQEMIDRFAELTNDHQWIHVDVERAEREIGSTVAHGFLTLSLMPQMVYEVLKFEGVGRSLNYGFDRLRFTNVVKAGARIRLRQTLAAATPKAGGLGITRAIVMEIEGDPKPAVVADWTGILYPAEPDHRLPAERGDGGRAAAG